MRVIQGKALRFHEPLKPVQVPGVRIAPSGAVVVQDVDVDESFSAAVERLRAFVRSRATMLSCGDRDLAADLVQEAWIRLWELDPLRFDDDDQAFVRASLVAHMRNVVRRELHLGYEDKMVRLHARVA